MLIVGLTGGLASGKSTVAGMFQRCGAKTLNADNIAKQLLWRNSPCFKTIVRVFGQEILTAGRIDRKKLSEIVFQDAKQLEVLENIIHPEVRKRLKKRSVRFSHKTICVWEVPLLFESGMDELVDVTITVKAGIGKMLERASKTKGITNQEAKRRLNRQWPMKEKSKRSDFTIDNQHNKKQTYKQVKRIWQKLQQMVKK